MIDWSKKASSKTINSSSHSHNWLDVLFIIERITWNPPLLCSLNHRALHCTIVCVFQPIIGSILVYYMIFAFRITSFAMDHLFSVRHSWPNHETVNHLWLCQQRKQRSIFWQTIVRYNSWAWKLNVCDICCKLWNEKLKGYDW